MILAWTWIVAVEIKRCEHTGEIFKSWNQLWNIGYWWMKEKRASDITTEQDR